MSSQSELTTDQRATQLRTDVVDRLVTAGIARSPAIQRALRTVPRHLFAPEADLDRAYDESAIIGVKHDERATLSSVSAAWLQATMLEQADVRPGQHVLEIGSGGYNAALLAELTGSAGSVTTVDIDLDITDRASRLLDEAGHLSSVVRRPPDLSVGRKHINFLVKRPAVTSPRNLYKST